MSINAFDIEIRTHYHKDDLDFSGDYGSVDVLINNEEVVSFGDAYHDKGADKADAWVDGFQYAIDHYRTTETTFKRTSIADEDW